jgi:hypothetical protein
MGDEELTEGPVLSLAVRAASECSAAAAHARLHDFGLRI